MPDPRWGALGMGRQPAPGPRVPSAADLDIEAFLERLRGLIQGDGPSFASRTQDLSRMQRERFAAGERGPPPPNSPEYQLGLEMAGNLKGRPSVLSVGPIGGLLYRALPLADR